MRTPRRAHPNPNPNPNHNPNPNPSPDPNPNPNQVRRDALRIIQRFWKPLVRRWLQRTRAALATPHSFAAANVRFDQLSPTRT